MDSEILSRHSDSLVGSTVPTVSLEWGARVEQARLRTSRWLLDHQHSEGYWCGELQGDTILESEYILLLAWLGREDSEAARKAAEYIRQQQLPSGGWAMFPGGSIEISGSVKAYFALKLTGHDPGSEYMQRARRAILAGGGADCVNSFTRFYLALLGQISYKHCPAVPPEATLLPAWFPLNIYRISAWSRTILVPLSIMWAHRPSRELPERLGISELFILQPDKWPQLRCPGMSGTNRRFNWEQFFRGADRLLKFCESIRIRPLRRRALRVAKQWMLDRMENSDGLGAIFPPMIWSVVALKSLGYGDDSAEVKECLDQLEALVIEDKETIRLQPCKSPVWDTAISLRALVAASASDEPAVAQATNWLMDKEVRRAGDWAKTVNAKPAGWFFEHRNEFYPDVDDTAMVMMALREQMVAAWPNKQQPEVTLTRVATIGQAKDYARQITPSPNPVIADTCERARRWILSMQNKDGGWGAFDKDNDSEFLCHVPFADHNAMIDPSTPDLTGRVLEALGGWGMSAGHPAIDQAVKYLRATQEEDGSWFGRWGVNYIYGTWQVVVGLVEAGIATNDPVVSRGADWLIAHQQKCGGWGETAESYEYPELRGTGPVTASQTAWALLGLIAAGRAKGPSVDRGIQYLVNSQRDDGGWDEEHFTGTGFPLVFYLRYHLYPIYFPLLALAKWQACIDS